MAAQPGVKTAEGATLPFDDVAGHRFCLLAIDVPADQLGQLAGHPLWSRLDANRLAMSGSTIGREGPDAVAAHGFASIEPVPQMPPQFAAMRGRIVLIRPDRYIAGVFRPSGAQQFAQRYIARIDAEHAKPAEYATPSEAGPGAWPADASMTFGTPSRRCP